MYTHETTVRLYDTDAAGWLFFGNHFRIAHAAYEALMQEYEHGLGDYLREGKILLPLVHASADYHKPSYVGDRIKVETTTERISEHSFTLLHALQSADGELVAKVTTAHVCIDGQTHKKKSLPSDLLAVLDKLK